MYLKNKPFAKPLPRQQSDTKIELQPKPTTSSSDSKSNVAFSFSSNKKLGVLAGVAAAIAIIVIVGFTGTTDSDVSTTITEPLLVNVDQTTYQRADIISISGNSKSASTQSVELTIENTNGVKIWSENINPKNDGQFSTLIIAGGGGWENDGVYILKATHSDFEIEFVRSSSFHLNLYFPTERMYSILPPFLNTSLFSLCDVSRISKTTLSTIVSKIVGLFDTNFQDSEEKSR
jgi:hypothetical protein